MTSSLHTLAQDTPGLTVVTRDESGFIQAVEGRAFNLRGIPSDAGNEEKMPNAVLTATRVEAVQAAVEYCSKNSLKIAVRSGGHSWHTSWLHGKGSVLLDVGDMNDVIVDESSRTATIGPGAKNVLDKIPDNLFYPAGHCPGVPAAGFLLGGGFGLGAPRYGMTCMLVNRIQAVLASGEVVEASKTGASEQERALFNLMKGSYSGFPAVVTSFTVELQPAPVVLMGAFFFRLTEWRSVLKKVLDLQWKGDSDASNIEAVLMMGFAPPPLAEATGVSKVAMLILVIWGDSEQGARSLYDKYTKDIPPTLVPPDEPNVVTPVEVTQAIGQSYPAKARYASQGFVGDESLFELSSYEEIEALLEPVVDMHLTESILPPPSHTIVFPLHPRLQSEQHKQEDLAFGFTPSLGVLSYAIYQDNELDIVMETTLKDSHQQFVNQEGFKTEMSEGHVAMTGPNKCFMDSAFATVQEQIRLLDPSGVFAGFQK